MIVDFETDQGVIDNLEAVTYTSVAAGNPSFEIPDAAFYRTGGLVEGAPSQGVYVKSTGRFAIRPSRLSSVGGARPADTITRADGSVWTVLRALPPVISVWQIDVIDLILSNGLVQSGTLLRPSNTGQDSAGRQALTSYVTIAANIPCRVQPIGGEASDRMDRRAIPQRFIAFLGEQVVPQALDLFAVESVSYTVLDFKRPARIDELMTLSLELIDQGSSPPPSPSPPAPGLYFPPGWR